MAAETSYYDDVTSLERQALFLILRLWRGVDTSAISPSWGEQLPEALAILVAAQTVGAELADPYLTEALDDAGLAYPSVDIGGMVPSGLDALLYRPAVEAKTLIGQGMAASQALLKASGVLSTYVDTSIADTARLAVTAGMTGRSHASGYYRFLRAPSCARCAILAGKFYRWNAGFKRHPRCDCGHRPVRNASDTSAYDTRKAIERGEVKGLSKVNARAILEFGANPSQVVNAQSGMYDIGQFTATTTGTTRRGVAGARILSRDVARALGGDVSGQTFRNMTFDRYKAAEYAELFRRGKTFARTTSGGRTQQYAYRYTRTPRPSPQQIVTSASSRDEAVRLLTNYGYIF